MAVTQLVPRTLEQSILHHFHCSINGDDQLVRFRYTSFNPSTLNSVLVLGKIAIPVKVVSKGIILPIYSSKQLLLLLLAVGSRRTIDRYMNHVLPIVTSQLGPVNLQELFYADPLLSHPLVHRLPTWLLPV